MNKRGILIVLDSVGIGALPDAKEYGDEKAHTLGNIAMARKHLEIPNLISLGLGNIKNSGLPQTENPISCFGRAMEKTPAKDTTSGHWELMGLISKTPLKTYKNGFPDALIKEFEKKIGRKTLCNKPASGTAIIADMGEKHVKTGSPIVYTSADSVFQIAAHEDIIPLKELYYMCEIARQMLQGDNLVGRVIARPFTGEKGNYIRTKNRKDYSIPPPGETILDALTNKGLITAGIGKIEDIFNFRGIGLSEHTTDNKSGIEAVLDFLNNRDFSLLFANLVDFDMLYGHRNDVEGYAKALEYFDRRLPEILSALKDDDLLIITADHGCDPTTEGTDHTREYIPILAIGKGIKKGVSINTRQTFADIGATLFSYLTNDNWNTGLSFLREISYL